MGSLLKISEAGAMALHAGVYMAARRGDSCTAGAMARDLQVSEAHLVKVLQRLTHAGFVRTSRGPRGGYALGRLPSAIKLSELYEAIEGPLDPVGCLLKHKACQGTPCILGDHLRRINREVMDYLTAISLDDVARAVNWMPEPSPVSV